MTGKIFLSGGGDENATKMLDEMFFAELPQNSSILYFHTPEAWFHTMLLLLSCFVLFLF